MELEILDLYHHLSSQAQTLLAELDAFKQHIESLPRTSRPDIHLTRFRTDVAREAKQLDRHGNSLSSQPLNDDAEPPPIGTNASHQIRSSNITHLAAIWDELKRSEGVTGLRKQVRYVMNPSHPASYHSNGTFSSTKQSSNARQRSKIYSAREAKAQRDGHDEGTGFKVPRSDKECITVDIVAEHGAKWIKVFTKSQRWLVMDMAREGIVDIAQDSTNEQEAGGELDGQCNSEDSETIDALGELKLVKMGQEFLTAAKTTRVNHCHPTIHFVLPKIERGLSTDVDVVLHHLEHIGITITTGDQLPAPNHIRAQPEDPRTSPNPPPFSSIISLYPTTPLSNPLNIDTTLLIALTSDISHLPTSHINIPTHYDGRLSRADILFQISSDEIDPLLLHHIYPVLRGRTLTCTRAAASHLRGIVRVMGSPSETARSELLFGGGCGKGHDPDPTDKNNDNTARNAFARTSIHLVPSDLDLPIQIVDNDNDDDNDDNPTTASASPDPRLSDLDHTVMRSIALQPRLSPLNKSVFFHGWRNGLTTVSLNRVVAGWVRRAVDRALDEIEAEEEGTGDVAVERAFLGVRVLVCGRERSLLGSEKGGESEAIDS